MNNKTIIIIVALIGIGLYTLPQTMALFAGQHSFYNIDPTGNQVPCDKCHGDIQAELESGISTLTGTPGPHADMKCEFCHRLQIGQSSGDNGYTQIIYSGAGVSRKIALNLVDLEARNIPIQIGPLSTYNDILNATTISGNPMTTQFSISPCYSGSPTIGVANCNSNSLILLPQNETDIKVFPLYTSSGTPIDINPVTQNSGFDVSKITWNGSKTVLNGTGSRTVNPGTSYHVASLVSCLECHRGTKPITHDRIVNASDGNACEPCHYGIITVPPPDISCTTGCHTSPSTYHHNYPSTTYQCLDCHPMTNFFERDCRQCHSGIPFPSNPIVFIPTKPHHDRGRECSSCHNGTGFTVSLDAGGFGLSNNPNDIGDAEVHNAMMSANDGNLTVNKYGASNSGCISCHTHVDVEISYTRPTTLVFVANRFADGNWSIGGFTAIGSNTTKG